MGVAIAPGLGYVLKEMVGNKSKFKDQRRLRATIKRLEKQELVNWGEKNGEVTLTLTEKGKRKVLKYKIDSLELKKPNRWDGLFRVIVFDIPEEMRIARDLFREKLKQLEFYQLQKSVFVIPFECRDEIDFLRHNLEIAPYVHYMLVKQISNIDTKVAFR